MDRAALMAYNRQVADKIRRYVAWDWVVVALSGGLGVASGALAVWTGDVGVRVLLVFLTGYGLGSSLRQVQLHLRLVRALAELDASYAELRARGREPDPFSHRNGESRN